MDILEENNTFNISNQGIEGVLNFMESYDDNKITSLNNLPNNLIMVKYDIW